jgi:hypothetical protein
MFSAAVTFTGNNTTTYNNSKTQFNNVVQLGPLGAGILSIRPFISNIGQLGGMSRMFTCGWNLTYPDASKLVVNITISSNSTNRYSDCFSTTIQNITATGMDFVVQRTDNYSAGSYAPLLAHIIVYQLL